MTDPKTKRPESTVTENSGMDLLAKAMRRVFREEVEQNLETESPTAEDPDQVAERVGSEGRSTHRQRRDIIP